ncbi:DUF1189 domain-containing protein [Carnobacterium sp. TMP28]|uniref:DUF1189 domain-containing protein n=1 Tax=Carnobacterium sp. TMP28 TaxID=3397060 RepID=UPI0039E07D4B
MSFLLEKLTITKNDFIIVIGVIDIQLFNLMKASFLNPEKLSAARSLNKKKIILYLIVLSFITAVPTWIQGNKLIADFKRDGQKIAEQLPSFKIEDDQLVTEEGTKSFIYQTDSIIFTFDPTGEQTPEDVKKNTIGTTIGLALLKDGLYLSAPGYPGDISYSKMNGLDNTFFADLFLGMERVSSVIFILSFILIWLVNLLIVVIYNLLYTVFANLVSTFSRRSLRFSDNWKIVLFASTLPTVFFAVLNSFQLTPYLQLEATLAITIYFYYLAIKKIPKEKIIKK